VAQTWQQKNTGYVALTGLPETSDLWLKGESDAAAALMKPANEDVLVSRPVSKAVGNVKNNGPELLLAVS
jgi:putative SOS response-associated peptidase YedK